VGDAFRLCATRFDSLIARMEVCFTSARLAQVANRLSTEGTYERTRTTRPPTPPPSRCWPSILAVLAIHPRGHQAAITTGVTLSITFFRRLGALKKIPSGHSGCFWAFGVLASAGQGRLCGLRTCRCCTSSITSWLALLRNWDSIWRAA
jgi:hypothetical protein